MKRYLVPAFFVIHAANEAAANETAGMLSSELNIQQHGKKDVENFLLLDEVLPTREVPINDEETELPHTYQEITQTTCKKCGSPLEHDRCTDETCPYSDYDQNSEIPY